jgi:hypothetical protein
MKSTGTIAVLIVAGGLFAMAPALLAQDEPRYRSSRPQTNPAAAPAGVPEAAIPRPQFSQMTQGPPRSATPLPRSTPRFRRQRNSEMTERISRPENITQTRSSSRPTATSDLKAGPTPRSSPMHRRSKKLHAKNPDQSRERNIGPAASPGTPGNHKPGEGTRESERPIVSPPTPGMPPTRAPESVSPAVPPPVAAPAGPRTGPLAGEPPQAPSKRPLNDLSEDERTRLHSAHQRALQRDPNLAASRARYLNARKEFREKLRDALLKADPSVQPILEKIRREKVEDH